MVVVQKRQTISMISVLKLAGHAVQRLLVLALLIAEVTGHPGFRVPLRKSSSLVRQEALTSSQPDGGWPRNNLQGQPGEGYYIDMGIGTPPQVMQVLVDTGSSNFAVAAAPHPYIPYYYNNSKSSSYESLEQEVSVPYTQGEWDGYLGRDLITIPSFLNITATANIAGITESDNFFVNGSHWQGIIGLAYDVVARPDSSLKPFFDSLVEQSEIDNVFSMQLCATLDNVNQSDNSMGGTMILGGVDSSLYRGKIVYAMMYREWYYEVIITAITVGEDTIDLDCKEYNFDKTIVDSGTTNLRLPQKVYEEVTQLIVAKTNIPNHTVLEGFITGEEVLCWGHGNTPWNAFPSLTITLAISFNKTMELGLGPEQYMRSVPDTGDDDCYKYAIASSKSGAVLGAVVMESFYVVFDRANKRVGFAETTCRSFQSSNQSAFVKGPFTTSADVEDCAYHKPTQTSEPLMVAAYIMGGVCILAFIPLVAFAISLRCKRRNEEPLHDFTDLLAANVDENAREEETAPVSD